MRQIPVILLSLLLLLAPAQPTRADPETIAGVIGGQLDAFRADDFGAAFDFASPTIREIFRTPEGFGAMVRGGYPMVWRPGHVRYLDLREIAGALWQRVEITDSEGAVHLLDYQMIQLPDGWRINAVQLLKALPPAV